MYLHLGNEKIVKDDDIIGIFDLDTTTNNKNTKRYLALAQKAGEVECVTYDLPKTFVVCNENGKRKVYLSQISSMTLKKRNKKS